MQRFADSHTRLEAAEPIARFLIDERFSTELGHIRQARVLFILSQREVKLRGHGAAAYICGTRVQGAMSAFVEDLVAQFAAPVFEGHDPDFIVRVDAACWDALEHTEPAADFWRSMHVGAPAGITWSVGRERLIFHELKHIVQLTNAEGELRYSQEDGRPVLALRPHDAELFHDELETYGPTVCGAEDTAIALSTGIALEKRRALRIA